jgi:hypothetical protein
MLAAAVLGGEEREDCDTLGISACMRPTGSIVIAFDTEQSKPDQFDLANRAAIRAGVEVLPDWIECYNLAGCSPADLRSMLLAKVAELKAKGVPVWFIVLDGIADHCADINSILESQEVTSEIHVIARESDCPIIAIIHRNEGRDADPSARGHLGKQLARKSAFNLTLEKDDNGVTVVYSTKNRGAPILKKDGPRFAWSDAAMMQVTVESGKQGEAGKVEEMRSWAAEVFEGKSMLRYSELHAALMTSRVRKTSWAENTIKAMSEADIIRKSGTTHYILN